MSYKPLFLISAILLSSSVMFAVEGNEGGIPITQNSRMGLKETQNRAWSVASAADTVYITSPVMQPVFLNQIKDDIDYMQRQLTALQQQETSLTRHEREAVEEGLPLLNNAEENADLALNYWNANTDHLRGDHLYRSYLKTIRENCKDVEKLLKPALGQKQTSLTRKILTLGYGW